MRNRGMTNGPPCLVRPLHYSSSSKLYRRLCMVIFGLVPPVCSFICSNIDTSCSSETWQEVIQPRLFHVRCETQSSFALLPSSCTRGHQGIKSSLTTGLPANCATKQSLDSCLLTLAVICRLWAIPRIMLSIARAFSGLTKAIRDTANRARGKCTAH